MGRGPEPSGTIAAFVGTWVAATFASSLVITVGGAPDETSIPLLAASLIVGWTVFLLGTWLTSRELGSGDARADFALTARPVDLIGVPIGVASQLLLVPAVYLPLRALWPDVFDDDALTETANDLVDRADGGLIIVLFALVVIGAPVIEEVVYRGLLQRPLLDRGDARHDRDQDRQVREQHQRFGPPPRGRSGLDVGELSDEVGGPGHEDRSGHVPEVDRHRHDVGRHGGPPRP